MNSENNSSVDFLLETQLKDLLAEMLQILEKHIQNEEELNQIQQHLLDYETLNQLVDTMKFIFRSIAKKLNQENSNQKYFKCEPKEQNYDKLELAIQKQEQEIRNHIRSQHEMKIYVEQLQSQLEESELLRLQYVQESTLLISKLKKENYLLLKDLKEQHVIDCKQNLQQQQYIRSGQISRREGVHEQKPQNSINTSRLQSANTSQLFKMIQKDSQKSLTNRQSNRNKSYSVGISKHSSMNSSFLQKQELQKLQRNCQEIKHRASIEQMKK